MAFYLLSNSCFCGNELNEPPVSSIRCDYPCETKLNNATSDCCGGRHALSVYNTKNYR